MADIALAVAAEVSIVESVKQLDGVAGEAITPGAPVPEPQDGSPALSLLGLAGLSRLRSGGVQRRHGVRVLGGREAPLGSLACSRSELGSA